jgi:hypothetical protein
MAMWSKLETSIQTIAKGVISTMKIARIKFATKQGKTKHTLILN